MTDTPETLYTRSADGTNLAYQMSGEGPHDVVFVHGGGVPIDLLSEDPGFIRVRKRLGAFSRTVWFDARGWGASEGHPHEAMVRSALGRHRGHEVKTTGDGFLATFDATGRALRSAADILAGAKDIGLELRAGVHAGEVEVRGGDIAGLAVTIAKRVCDLAGPGELLVSETVRGHMVGGGVEFRDRAEHELKGVPGTWKLFSVGG